MKSPKCSVLRPLLTSFILVVSIALPAGSANAWADRGHEIVGQIAEETMKPSTRDWMRGVLGLEPLAVAAVFPDHVRSDDRFAHYESDPAKREGDIHNFDEYHYCEIPHAETYDTRKKKIVKDCFGAINGAIEILKSKSQTPEAKLEKQIAIRYLAHVIGDIGNPLHVGNGHDRGGNLCRVKWQVGNEIRETNLHSVWDDLLIQHLGQTYAETATNKKPAIYLSDYMITLRERFKESLNQAGKEKHGAGTTQSWLEEGAALRESGIYPDDPKQMKDVEKGQEPFHRTYCETDSPGGEKKKASTSLKPALLDQAYAEKFTPIAELQMVKAGLRLAHILDTIADAQRKSKAPLLTEKQQDSVLRNVQTKFKNKK